MAKSSKHSGSPLLKSRDGEAELVAWENRKGKHYTLIDSDGERVRRNPSQRTIETAQRVVVRYGDRYYTIRNGLNPDFDLDDVISEIESDRYKSVAS